MVSSGVEIGGVESEENPESSALTIWGRTLFPEQPGVLTGFDTAKPRKAVFFGGWLEGWKGKWSRNKTGNDLGFREEKLRSSWCPTLVSVVFLVGCREKGDKM